MTGEVFRETVDKRGMIILHTPTFHSIGLKEPI